MFAGYGDDHKVTSSPVPQPERPPSPMKSPSKRTMVGAVCGIVAAVGGLLTLLWVLVDGNSAQPSTQLELVRIALTILLGTGGLFGLYLAWRRQRSTEIALQQKERDQIDVARAYALQERSALASEADAAARRITDLYTKAVEQLGSDKAPVRLGGLYALERLAQDHPEQRQTIVNVLCAYLRMPFSAPGESPSDDDLPEPGDHVEDPVVNARMQQVVAEYWQRVQELEVRTTAQRILAMHLRPGPDPENPVGVFWSQIDLDLTGASLVDLDFNHCQLHVARFVKARFVGHANLRETRCDSAATFNHAVFTSDAAFHEARFIEDAEFGHARFSGRAVFSDATFRRASFGETVFAGQALFRNARFSEPVWFHETQFKDAAEFRGASFAGTAGFGRARFSGYAEFREARFEGAAEFDSAQFEDTAWFKAVPFAGGARFASAIFGRNARFDDAQFSRNATFDNAHFLGTAGFTNSRFTGNVTFDICHFEADTKFGSVTFDADPSLQAATFKQAVPSELARFQTDD
jgi:uncharacterized protein YjbI with pentapeptide repeats